MAGRRRSKVVLEPDKEFTSPGDEESKDNIVRRRTLSISHSGRFKEQRRRGVLSEGVFAGSEGGEDRGRTSEVQDRSVSSEDQQDRSVSSEDQQDRSVSSEDARRDDPAQPEADSTQRPAANKMAVVFETKL